MGVNKTCTEDVMNVNNEHKHKNRRKTRKTTNQALYSP